ncbi:hypothetical protein ACJ41O_003073 [Fusarium nematophilum]
MCPWSLPPSATSSPAPSGLLKTGTPPLDGIFSGADTRNYLPPGNFRLFGPKDNPQSDLYADLTVSAHEPPLFYVALCKDYQLRDSVSRFTGWKNPQMLQRTILRVLVPELGGWC